MTPKKQDIHQSKKSKPNNFEEYGIYKRFEDVSFSMIEKNKVPQDKSFQQNYSVIKKYANNIQENIKSGRGLTLIGGVGTMKTTLSVAVLRHWLELSEGNSGLLVTMPGLINNLFVMKERNKEEWANYERRLRNTPLLILDDMGAEYGSDWIGCMVESIVVERYNKMKPIIITSNLSSKEISNRYSQRIMDRLKATNEELVFMFESLRPKAEQEKLLGVV